VPPAEKKLEPFKELFNRRLVEDLAAHLKRRWKDFNDKAFVAAALKDFKDLEMKARAHQIATALGAYLPRDVPRALKLLVATLRPLDKSGEPVKDPSRGLAGMVIWPMGDYVARHGLAHVNESLAVLRELTIRSTAEFAIRPFLARDPKKTLSVMKAWAKDANHHVRRLASEGSRPRLPWGLRLKAFVADPAPILPILESLKNDPSEYVRRSVANSLNDIAKDHPDLVAGIAAKWMKGASKERARLVRHACRSLIKSGHDKTLAALGFSSKPDVALKTFTLDTPTVKFGGHAAFTVELHSTGKAPQNIVLDYVVHHQKKNGETTPKVFKWKTLTLKPGNTVRLDRRHALKSITTRTYYPGRHRIDVTVNGLTLGGGDFELLIKTPKKP
jgi:3-methyladenine DNA glycosylase AlkC